MIDSAGKRLNKGKNKNKFQDYFSGKGNWDMKFFRVGRNRVRKGRLNNEEGFTLIEIIAVIIILGIMAAVAVPKFFSMQEDAKQAVINGALAEGAARFNHAYGKYILMHSAAPPDIAALTTGDTATPPDYLGPDAATGATVGDFVIKWTAGTASDEVDVTVISCETINNGDPLVAGPNLILVKTIKGIEWGSGS